MLNSIRIALAALLVLGGSGLAYTQEPNPDPSRREAAPRQEPRETEPPRAQEPQPPRPPEGEKAPPPGRQESPRPKEEPRATPEEHGRTANEPRAGQEKRVHIPDPQFKANFGRQHTFAPNRVITGTTIVPRQTQFVMAGYTFVILDPWPAEWLFTDDCYIDFVEGDYFLLDVLHPGMRVALLVVG